MPINADDIEMFAWFDGSFIIINLPVMAEGELLEYQDADILYMNGSYAVFGEIKDDAIRVASVITEDPYIADWLYNLDRPLVIRW